MNFLVEKQKLLTYSWSKKNPHHWYDIHPGREKPGEPIYLIGLLLIHLLIHSFTIYWAPVICQALWRYGFPGGSDGKAFACNVGDSGSIPGSGRSSGEGNGNPFQYPCLESPMDGGAWYATVHGVTKSWTWLSDFTFLFPFHGDKEEIKQIMVLLFTMLTSLGMGQKWWSTDKSGEYQVSFCRGL